MPVRPKPIPTPTRRYLLENGLWVKILLPKVLTEKMRKSVYTEKAAKINVLTVSGSKPL